MTNDFARKDHIRLRRRILYGQHEQDIRNRIAQSISHVRANAWGPVDMTSNPFKQIHDQLSALYNEEPVLVGPTNALQATTAVLDDIGYWTKMKGVQRDVSALREMLMLVEPVPGGITILQVTPDEVDVVCSPRNPDEILSLKWYNGTGDDSVVIEYNVKERIYRAVKGMKDVSIQVLGGDFSGDKYPFKDALGNPIMPWIFYRAEDTGSVFNSWTGREAVEATLQLSVHYTFYSHILRNAAWAQRYIVNAEPLGADMQDDDDTNGSSTRANVTSDPSTVLILKGLDNGQQPSVGTFATPVDPQKVIESIRMYEERILEQILGASVVKSDADIRSGYSLAVSREAQLKAQKGFEPLFRRADRRLLKMVAGYLGYNTSYTDWDVLYPAIMSDAEKVAAGLMPALPGTQV